MGKFIICVVYLCIAGAGNSFCQEKIVIKAKTDGSKSPTQETQQLQDIEQERMMELKKNNPQAYAAYIKSREKDKKKNDILEALRSGRIQEQDARAQLRIIFKEEINIQNEVVSIDRRIEMLQAELKRLQRFKENPDDIINERVDGYLGVIRD